MASSNTEFSQMLQHITDAKLDELSNKREIFLRRKAAALEKTQSLESPVEQLHALSDGVKECFGIPVVDGRMVRNQSGDRHLEIFLGNLDRFLKQAQYDPSISPQILDRWHRSLLSHLDIQTLKYEYATLFAQLTMEWLSAKKGPVSDGDVSVSDEYEKIASARKLESRKQWEESIFTPVDRDANVIQAFLDDLFGGALSLQGETAENSTDNTKDIKKGLQTLRDLVSKFESSLAHPSQFNVTNLGWVISGLISSDLLSEQKRAVLRDFENNDTILKELADVLNMRLAALHAWSWGVEVPVEQRRRLNGTYHVHMHEDLIQAIFLQYIGVKWSVFFKQAFNEFRKTRNVWKSPRSAVPAIDKKRREFFVWQRRGDNPNVQITRERIYRKAYFVSQLLDSEKQERRQEQGEEEAEFAMPVSNKLKRRAIAARRMVSRKEEAGEDSEEGEDMGFALIDDDDYNPDEYYDDQYGKSVMEPPNQIQAKQNLLHLLRADIVISTRLHGEITCFRSQYEPLESNLPHATVLSVLRFLGVSEKWIAFFERFLTAPLRFVDDSDSKPRVRRRGTPGSHVLSEVFGETILFCLDFLINKETDGQLLWRVHDDLWFWSSSQQTCATAWRGIQRFNEVMGISLNSSKTGSARIVRGNKAGRVPEPHPALPGGQIRWGMLYLNPESGRFEIDQEMVDNHIDELSRQLRSKEQSVFGWIQAWNSYATTFFTSNFGKPANCFGSEHVDMMLQTHKRLQRQVFDLAPGNGEDDRSVVTYLRELIESRFGVSSVPDGYFFLPIDLGGLELSSPFINLLGLRETVVQNPDTLLDEFLEEESDRYAMLKMRFEAADKERIIKSVQGFCPPDSDTFMSFEEYTRYREVLNYGFGGQLVEVYDKLLQRPEPEPIEFDYSGSIFTAVNKLGGQDNLTGVRSDWDSMTQYWRWVAQLYGPEIVERFGGFNIVDPGLLPIGLVSLFRSGRVNWKEE